MITTGKHARKRYGTRVAAKRAKARRPSRKTFGQLPVSASKGNVEQFNREARPLVDEYGVPLDAKARR